MLYNLAESIRIAATLIAPFMPSTTPKILAQLGLSEDAATWEQAGQWGVLPLALSMTKGETLFPRIDMDKALAELEEANAALRGDMERARELERQRLAFFSAASHELKTPVTILKGQLTGMLDEVGVYRDRDRYLARSLQVTSRMEALVGEILTISRMESGTGLRKEEVDLSRLVEEQLEQDRELLDQREMDLSLSLAPGLVLRGDPSLLGRAVDNLLSNAALYSPAGARIRVRTLRLDGRPTLVVENTGVQIGAEALLRLFEPFYREEQSRNRRTGGSGLGLYLVKMILDRHGARCEIENITDGVRARVIFPTETAS